MFKFLALLLLMLQFSNAHCSLQHLQKGMSNLNSDVVPQKSSRTTRDAYVTLLYGGFLSGARVLGQSLRETNTEKDLVALCTQSVPKSSRNVLKAEGWIIKSIDVIHNPYEGLSYRGTYFSGIFTKLHIWNMTEYERIVYLDSDVIVVANIDHLFDCGTFCAAYRHSDLFNAGVLIVEPSRIVFEDMIMMIPELPSYDDGDQGFLNVYFKDLRYASMFNWSDDTRQRQPMRIPNGLNADVGLYYLNSRWLIPKDELKVIHYTLGPIKPWMWWTNILFDLNGKWHCIEHRVNQYMKYNDTLEPQQPIYWLPFVLSIALYIFMRSINPFRCWTNPTCGAALSEYFVLFNTRFSHFLPLIFLFLSYSLAFSIVPTTIYPYRAEYVFWMWSNFFLFLFFGLYCYLSCITTKAHKNPNGRLQSGVLYLVFNSSYFLLKVATPAIKPFGNRVCGFFILLALHLTVSQVVGQKMIRVWSRVERIKKHPRIQ